MVFVSFELLYKSRDLQDTYRLTTVYRWRNGPIKGLNGG